MTPLQRLLAACLVAPLVPLPAAPAATITPSAPAAAPAPAPAPAASESGYARFLAGQRERAKAAVRAREHDEAERAWLAVLELDPVSREALEGLAEIAKTRKDADAELVALVELAGVIEAQVRAGERVAERDLAKVTERIAALDPFDGEADLVVDEWTRATGELAQRYLDDGLHLSALVFAKDHLRLLPEGSEELEPARARLARVLTEGGDDVARLGGDLGPADALDAAWIEEHDRKTGSWSRAAKTETPHYRVKTNAGWRMLTTTADVMEQAQRFYREVWGIVPDPKPEFPDPALRDISITPIAVEVYREREEYLKRSGGPEWSGGVFTGDSVKTYDTSEGGRSGSYRATFRTLFHEASHQFMSEAVGDVPSFVNEGVACLFEGVEVLSNGSIRRDLPVLGYLSPLVSAIRAGTALALAEVMGGKDANANEPEFYMYRWGLFYYLRMAVDEQGRYVYRDRMLEYIYAFQRGAPGDMVEHFTEWFVDGVPDDGIDTFEQFEARWKAWILALDEELKGEDKRLEEYVAKGEQAANAKEHEQALAFFERALDIDGDHLDALHGAGRAAAALDRKDRAIYLLDRFERLAALDDSRRKGVVELVGTLDPHRGFLQDSRRAFSGGMASLAQRYDKQGMPRTAMATAQRVLAVDPFDPAAAALVRRLESETGRSAARWQRLFNGFDLDGWYGDAGMAAAYSARDGVLVAASEGLEDQGAAPAEGELLYRVLLVDRPVDGDWVLEAHIEAEGDWTAVGLVFGAKDVDRYEAIVLRRPGRVDYGSFAGGWTFRGDGAIKADYDPEDGVDVRIEVRRRRVHVTLDGVPLRPVKGGRFLDALEYPSAALRGDIGVFAGDGTYRFSDLRLLAGAAQ